MEKNLIKFKHLEDEINHYKHIRVMLPDVEFAKFEVLLEKYYEKPKKKAELEVKLAKGQITDLEDLLRETAALTAPEKYSYHGKEVTFKHIQEHYYLPIIISDEDNEINLNTCEMSSM
jgi:type III restriction enzyme